MKHSIKLALSSFLVLSSTSLLATNGDLMIGQGTKSLSMGGVGVAKSFGSDSALANPALISSVRHSELSVSTTIFMPDVSFASNDFKSRSSSSDLSLIPEFSYARSYNMLTFGVVASGVAGMGVDYKNTFGTSKDNGSFDMQTELQLFKVAAPIAVNLGNGIVVGVAPILQFGSLEMNYIKSNGEESNNPKSNDTGLGFEIGAAWTYHGLTLGTVYKSEIEMSYTNNISNALNHFGLGTSITSGDVLTQPAEFGLGLSYVYHENTISFDYKLISWSSATGYGDFGWEDQNVFAIGYERFIDKFALRIGYNFADSPIVAQNGNTYSGAATNFFNLAGFPGIVEEHYTFGLGYDMSSELSLEAAFVYAPEVKKSFNITAMNNAIGTSPDSNNANVAHSQSALTLGLTYKFF